MSTVNVPQDFNYRTAGGKVTLASTPRPQPFTWGKVLQVHGVGDDYAIVEYAPRRASNVSPEDFDPSPQFSVFVQGASRSGWDTHHSWESLDKALLAAIAWRTEATLYGYTAAANSRAVMYIAQLLELDKASAEMQA